MTLTVGGGGSPLSEKTEVLLDDLQDDSLWTSEVGEDDVNPDGWQSDPFIGPESHAGPAGDTWLIAFTGFEFVDDTASPKETGWRMTRTFPTRDVSLMFNIGFFIAMDTAWHSPNSNIARLGAIKVYMGSDGDGSFDNSVVATHRAIGNTVFSALPPMARFMDFNRIDFEPSAGTFDWEDMQDIRIEIRGSDGVVGRNPPANFSPRVYLNGLYLNKFIPPTVVIGHDDGGGGIFTLGKPVLDSYGFKTTQYVLPESVEAGAPSMTLAQVTQMNTEGHDICQHATYSGDVLNTLTDAEITAEIIQGKAWQTTNGFTSAQHITSWPQGVTTSGDGTKVYDLFVAQGINTARTSESALLWYTTSDWSSNDTDDSGANNKNMRMPLQTINSNARPYQTVMPPLLDEVSKYGGILIFSWHNIVASGAADTGTNVADYDAAMALIKKYVDKGLMQVKTMSECFDVNGDLLI